MINTTENILFFHLSCSQQLLTFKRWIAYYLGYIWWPCSQCSMEYHPATTSRDITQYFICVVYNVLSCKFLRAARVLCIVLDMYTKQKKNLSHYRKETLKFQNHCFSVDHPFIKIKTFQNDDDEFEQYCLSQIMKWNLLKNWNILWLMLEQISCPTGMNLFWDCHDEERMGIFNNDNNNNRNINALYMTMNFGMKWN